MKIFKKIITVTTSYILLKISALLYNVNNGIAYLNATFKISELLIMRMKEKTIFFYKT